VQQGSELSSRILLHGGQGMGIDAQGDVDPLVAEPFLHHLNRHPRLQQRGAGMPQAVT